MYDLTTGQGIPDAIVFVRSTGPDFARGRGITAGNEAMDTTDARGRFRVHFGYLPDQTSGLVVARGYSPIALSRLSGDTLNVPMSRLMGDPHAVATSMIGTRLGAGSRRCYISIAEMKRVGTPDSADLSIEVIDDLKPLIVVRALRGAGLLRATLGRVNTSIDACALACLAPETGYAKLDTVTGSNDRVLYFVASENHARYGRLQFVPARLIGAAGSTEIGGAAVFLWVNIEGDRGVCGPDLSVYDKMVGGSRVLSDYIRGAPDRLHPSQTFETIGN